MALELGNQTLGRGKVYFSLFNSGTHTPSGFRYIGNTPSFNLTISQEKLDHFSSESGVRVKDKTVILQTDYSGNVTMDDINNANLALFFFGTQSTVAQTSATSQAEAFASVTKGFAYQLGVTTNNQTGVRSISNVTVQVSGSPKTLGTDYTVDAARGIIFIVESGTIADGATINVTYDRAAVNRKQVISGTTQVEGALRFLADNPSGQNNDFLMPYVRLGPNGDFELKSDEWQQLPCTVEILADTTYNKAAIYIDGQPY